MAARCHLAVRVDPAALVGRCTPPHELAHSRQVGEAGALLPPFKDLVTGGDAGHRPGPDVVQDLWGPHLECRRHLNIQEGTLAFGQGCPGSFGPGQITGVVMPSGLKSSAGEAATSRALTRYGVPKTRGQCAAVRDPATARRWSSTTTSRMTPLPAACYVGLDPVRGVWAALAGQVEVDASPTRSVNEGGSSGHSLPESAGDPDLASSGSPVAISV